MVQGFDLQALIGQVIAQRQAQPVVVVADQYAGHVLVPCSTQHDGIGVTGSY